MIAPTNPFPAVAMTRRQAIRRQKAWARRVREIAQADADGRHELAARLRATPPTS